MPRPRWPTSSAAWRTSSATTLVDWLPDARAYRDRPWYRQSLIPHELAHQWFGNLVTAENWANYWLNEGMAEFMAGQYWGDQAGARTPRRTTTSTSTAQFLALDARRRMPLAAYNSNNVYPKGALVLRDAEEAAGPRAVLGGDQPVSHPPRLRQRPRATISGRRCSTPPARTCGWFWAQWIYSAGYPEFAVTPPTTPPRAR